MAELGLVMRVFGIPGGVSLEVTDVGLKLVKLRDICKFTACQRNLAQVYKDIVTETRKGRASRAEGEKLVTRLKVLASLMKLPGGEEPEGDEWINFIKAQERANPLEEAAKNAAAMRSIDPEWGRLKEVAAGPGCQDKSTQT